MSSREPMWYCHECRAEMRPLMMPDPHCASCSGTFVERIDNPSDDPRDIRLPEAGNWEDGAPGEMDGFLAGLRSILQGPTNIIPRPTSPSSSTGGTTGSTGSRRSSGERPRSPTAQMQTTGRNGFTIRIERSSTPGGRSRTTILGGNPGREDGIPMLSQFAPTREGGNEPGRPNITGPMLAQYLFALMGPGRGGDPFADMLGGMFGPGGPHDGPEAGRWGDYVFNQEALDQIISQIMENNNAHQPVPAPEDVVERLPREVLEKGSNLLEKDCAVCKDQFQANPEDEAEKVVITLPCKHAFHEPCILPWLKTSGTCPVCRHQLVPQPEAHAPRGGPPTSSSSSTTNAGGSGRGGGGAGLLHNMFNIFSPSHSQGGSSSSSSGARSNPSNGGTGSSLSSSGASNHAPSSSSNGQNRSPRRDQDYDIPGGWADQID